MEGQPETHVDFNGLAFNVTTGFFIPVGYQSIIADLPYLDPDDPMQWSGQ